MRVLIAAFLLCVVSVAHASDPIRPDAKLTPGWPQKPIPALKVLCTPGHATAVRNVPPSEKHAVFAEYHINKAGGHYEVDHLISLELGGTNDIRNLWPQSYDTQPYNAHVKDRLEDHLHALACHQKVSIAEAQAAISKDWVAAYKKYMPMK